MATTKRGGSSAGGALPIILITLGVIAAAGVAIFLLGAQLFSAEGPQQDRPNHVVIGLDLSESNPLVLDDVYAAKVGRYVENIIEDLPLGSRVTLRTFGTFDARRNRLQLDRDISLRQPADQVASVVGGIIAGVPTLIERGELDAQPETNILAFMDNMSRAVDCRDMYTYYYLASDGAEESEFARLKSEDSALPRNAYDKASDAPFYRCRALTILGIGQGLRSPQATQRLRSEWRIWAENEGFREFSGLNDW